jgi:2-oxoglutarate dehydrogenase E2 component (dihydrolipoamide succinyltransferase)
MLRSLGRVARRAAVPLSAGGGRARVARALATHILSVPSMGDSITEGTIASVEKAVGDAVAVDEIIAVIDTDKVSVDVRSDTAGVVTSLVVAVDQDVEVGAELMTLDTDGAAAPAAAAPAPAAPEPAAPAPAPAAAPAAAPAHKGARVPSIKFLGKRSLLAKEAAPAAPAANPAAAPPKTEAVPSGLAVELQDLGPRFGLTPITEAEIAAVESGGGSECDEW